MYVLCMYHEQYKLDKGKGLVGIGNSRNSNITWVPYHPILK